MSRYVWTFVALLALTALTLGLSFVPMGAWSVVLAMLIAAVKAALVALFFMHLVEENTTVRVAVVVGLLLGGTLLALTVVDVWTRDGGADGSGEGSPPAALRSPEG